MRRSIEIVPPEIARAVIASAFLSSAGDDQVSAAITPLWDHQREAVARARSALREFGGVLIADPVGTGKTFVALAVAAEYARVAVVAPAVLSGMWLDSASRAEVGASFFSHEALSRGRSVDGRWDLVVVDEAHHARNPATRRFRSLSRLVDGARVVLLSATPIHNRRGDLCALLSLFLGERASSLTAAELARIVIRRPHAAVQVGAPGLAATKWLRVQASDDVPEAILALPPPVPAQGAGDGGSLITHSLVRQWASTDLALVAALRRRLQRAAAMTSALEGGVYPSRNELASWLSGDDAIQLGFDQILAATHGDASDLLRAVRAHSDAVADLLGLVRHSDADAVRASFIRRIRSRHADVPVVVFSQYEESIRAMFMRLVAHGGVAALSGRGVRIAAGRMSREEAIAQLDPRKQRRAASSHARISLLLATDLLSEGFNLQHAGVVVHLDLPWTPARMEQRIGRVARAGSSHSRVHSYAFLPPASAEMIVRIEGTLKRKMKEAAFLGAPFRALPEAPADDPGPVSASAELRSRLCRWLRSPALVPQSPLLAAVKSTRDGFIAACTAGGCTLLLGCLGQRVTDDPEVLLECLQLAEGPRAVVEERALERVCIEAEDHLRARLALSVDDAATSSRVRMLRRIASSVSRSRPHRLGHASELARDARAAILQRHGAHREQLLNALARGVDGEDWLRNIASLGEDTTGDLRETEVIALVLLVSSR